MTDSSWVEKVKSIQCDTLVGLHKIRKFRKQKCFEVGRRTKKDGESAFLKILLKSSLLEHQFSIVETTKSKSPIRSEGPSDRPFWI